jgi:hypothetical protein
MPGRSTVGHRTLAAGVVGSNPTPAALCQETTLWRRTNDATPGVRVCTTGLGGSASSTDRALYGKFYRVTNMRESERCVSLLERDQVTKGLYSDR